MKPHALASFWRCYDELPGHVQRLARKNFELFKANPRHPSLGFQKKGGSTRLRLAGAIEPLHVSATANTIGSGSERTKSTIASGSD